MARTQLDGFQIENDSVTGDDVNESTLLDTLIPFVDSEFSATNIHNAIAESRNKPFFGGTVSNNITVPSGKAAILVSPVYGVDVIKYIDGELVIL